MTAATPSRGLSPARQVLPNGATIVAKESRATPAVTLHAMVRAGTIYDPLDLGGLSHFVSRTIDRGTTVHAADAIADELDSRGVSLAVSVNRHAVSLVCTCLVEDVSSILALLAEIIRQPAFPPHEVETRRGEIVTLIRQDEDSPATVAVERLMRMLYGDEHPYGRPPRGTVGTVGRIDSTHLRAFHAARFRPEQLTLAIVGDIDRQRAIEGAAGVFGEWSETPLAASGVGMPPAPPLSIPEPSRTRRVQVIPMMNKAQADVAYGFTSITRDDPAFHACNLMNNILGQYSMGGRLGDTIRERQGMAYYVFSSLDANVIPGPLVVRAGVNPSNVERALASIDGEIARFLSEGPTDDEIAETKQYLIGSLPRNLETNTGIANYLQTMEFFELGLDYDVRVVDLVRAVTRDEVHAAARRTLDPAKAAVVIAGPYDGKPA